MPAAAPVASSEAGGTSGRSTPTRHQGHGQAHGLGERRPPATAAGTAARQAAEEVRHAPREAQGQAQHEGGQHGGGRSSGRRRRAGAHPVAASARRRSEGVERRRKIGHRYFAGVGAGTRGHLLRGAGGDQGAARRTSLRPQVDHPVRALPRRRGCARSPPPCCPGPPGARRPRAASRCLRSGGPWWARRGRRACARWRSSTARSASFTRCASPPESVVAAGPGARSRGPHRPASGVAGGCAAPPRTPRRPPPRSSRAPRAIVRPP